MKTIIGIDPGKGGGIAVFSKGKATVVKMPQSVNDLKDYFIFIKETYENPVVFIEKVQAYGAGDDAPGKKFGINKMLNNYTELLTLLKLSGFIFIEVYPITWQTTIGFGQRRPKEIPVEKWKTIRKGKYKKFAQQKFPYLKVTLQTSDALCLVVFAQEKAQNNFDWILEHAKKAGHTTFFGEKGKNLF